MSKFDFFDEGVRRVFENYELPLDKNAWANFQSSVGAGSSSNLLKAFVLPGLLVAGLFTALHVSTPNTQTHTAEHSSTEQSITTTHQHQASTTNSDHSSDINNTSESAVAMSSDNPENIGSYTNEDVVSAATQKIDPAQNKTESSSNTSNSDKKAIPTIAIEKEVQEKLPENMASEIESGTSRTKFLGNKYNLGAPKKITPNNDNINDSFMPPKLNKDSKFVMRIYDKVGNLVFVSNSVKDPWDGTVLNTNEPAEAGDYRWNVILETENKRREYGSNVKLVR